VNNFKGLMNILHVYAATLKTRNLAYLHTLTLTEYHLKVIVSFNYQC